MRCLQMTRRQLSRTANTQRPLRADDFACARVSKTVRSVAILRRRAPVSTRLNPSTAWMPARLSGSVLNVSAFSRCRPPWAAAQQAPRRNRSRVARPRRFAASAALLPFVLEHRQGAGDYGGRNCAHGVRSAKACGTASPHPCRDRRTYASTCPSRVRSHPKARAHAPRRPADDGVHRLEVRPDVGQRSTSFSRSMTSRFSGAIPHRRPMRPDHVKPCTSSSFALASASPMRKPKATAEIG